MTNTAFCSFGGLRCFWTPQNAFHVEMKKTMATRENALYAVHNLKNLVKIREDLLLGEADDQDWHLAD